MTLVVARQVNNNVYIVGDTKFTDSRLRESGQYIGGLKVVLLTPGLCIGFAGDVEFARRAIQGVYDKEVNLFDKNIAIEYFLKYHRDSVGNGLATDFIVAVITECNEQPGAFLNEIFRIANLEVYCENDAAHIGDNEAFNYFQEGFHHDQQYSGVPTLSISRLGDIGRPDFDLSLSSALNAMQGVIDNPEVLSVDGIRTAVVSEKDQFRYVQYTLVRGTPIPIRNEMGAPVSFGGVVEGSDIKQVGAFSAVGHGVFPVYWITGSVGLIYHPEECFEPTIISNCTQEEFRLMVEEKISVAQQRAIKYQMILDSSEFKAD